MVGPADTLVTNWITPAVVWSGVGSVNAIVAGREGQWRINKEEEKKNNDERGGGGASSISVKFCSCSCSFVCFGMVGCRCCCHHGTPALAVFPFLDCSALLDLLDTGATMRSDTRMRKNDDHLESYWAHHTLQHADCTGLFHNLAIGAVFQNVHHINTPRRTDGWKALDCVSSFVYRQFG